MPIFLTGALSAIFDGSTVQTWALYLAESVLGGATVYFFRRTGLLLTEGREMGTLQTGEMTCVILTVGIGVLSLSSLEIGFLSLGRIAAVLMILFSCRYGGAVGGSLSGIVAGAMFGLATSGISGISGSLAFAGLIAGLFSPLGRIATAAAFVLANGIGSLQVGSLQEVWNGLLEVMAASTIFMIWPAKTAVRLREFFRQPARLMQRGGMRRSVAHRLDVAADAMEQVSRSVETVSEKLRQIETVPVQRVFQAAADSVCGTCVSRSVCWGETAREQKDISQSLIQSLRIDGAVTEHRLPAVMKEACTRTEELAESINRNYREYLMKESAQRKLQQVQGVVTEQFSTTGKLLRDMAQEILRQENYDTAAEKRICEILHNRAVIPLEVSCRITKEGRVLTEIEVMRIDRHKLTKTAVLRGISAAVGRPLCYPAIELFEEKCRFRFKEKPVYRMVSGVAQHTCAGSSLCGDSCVCFEDDTGRQIAVLSDGMGTGGRAAVDGAMASGILTELVKAGIGFDCALTLTNSALMVKSGEETLSTLDAASVDLFTGEAVLRKAGAPVSYALVHGKAERLEAASLPVGILEEAVFCRTSVTLAENDLLILFSDGMLAGGEDWIAPLIEGWDGEEPVQLANLLVDTAVKYRSDGREDDVSAMVLRLEKRENILA